MMCSVTFISFIATLNISCSIPCNSLYNCTSPSSSICIKLWKNIFKIRHSKTYMSGGFIFTINFRPVTNTLAFFVEINFITLSSEKKHFLLSFFDGIYTPDKIDPFVELKICFLKNKQNLK